MYEEGSVIQYVFYKYPIQKCKYPIHSIAKYPIHSIAKYPISHKNNCFSGKPSYITISEQSNIIGLSQLT